MPQQSRSKLKKIKKSRARDKKERNKGSYSLREIAAER